MREALGQWRALVVLLPLLLVLAAVAAPAAVLGVSQHKTETTTNEARRRLRKHLQKMLKGPPGDHRREVRACGHRDNLSPAAEERAIREHAITPQHYVGVGVSAHRLLQRGTPVGLYSNGRKMRPQTQSSWGAIRIQWALEGLLPTESNARPDGDRACYVVGEWARRGNPAGDPPVGRSCTGTCIMCADGAGITEDCWQQCTEAQILTAEDFDIIQAMLTQAAELLSAMIHVQQVIGTLQLGGWECGELPPIESVENADLVLIVYARPVSPSSPVAAHASSCQVDQYGRPITGYVGITAERNSGVLQGGQLALNILVHEIYHAMGFTGASWEPDRNKLLDEDLNPRGTLWEEEFPYSAYRESTTSPSTCTGGEACDTVDATEHKTDEENQQACESAGVGCVFASGVPAGTKYSRIFIRSPRALIAARRFFGCSSLHRLEIEDEGGDGSRGSHWEQMHFAEAVISASSSSTAQFLEVTLSFFEDLGTYRTVTELSGWSDWGFQQGCAFAMSKDCGSTGWGAAGSGVAQRYSLPQDPYWPTSIANSAVVPVENGYDWVCSFDRKGKVPNKFRFFPEAERCNGAATSADDFDASCVHKPWQVHEAIGDSDGEANHFVGWGLDGTEPFRNGCPTLISSIDNSCVHGSGTYVSSNAHAYGVLGDTSRCFETNMIDARYTWGNSERGVGTPICLTHACTEFTLQVHFPLEDDNELGTEVVIDCPYSGGVVTDLPGLTGSLTCPPFAEICTVEWQALEAKRKLQHASALRVKGIYPSQGADTGGTRVRITARGLTAETSVYFGAEMVPADTCSCEVAMDGYTSQNAATCIAAGQACQFTAGLLIDTNDPMVGHVIIPTPASGTYAHGPADVVLKSSPICDGGGACDEVVLASESAADDSTACEAASSGDTVCVFLDQQDTGFAAFSFGDFVANLIDDAVTRPLSNTPWTGSTLELTTGPTWHMTYYWLQRDGAGFDPGTDDDLFYAVYLYYPADDDDQEAASFSIRTAEIAACRATDLDATEQQKFDCSRTEQSYCLGVCTWSLSQIVELTVDSTTRSAFQLLVNMGDVPSRRQYLYLLPSVGEVVLSGKLSHYAIDCLGEPATASGPAVDECGVCHGSNFENAGNRPAVNEPLLCSTVLTDAYIVTGSTDAFNGRYERLAAMCSGKHVFQLHDGNVVLFQPTGSSFWSIGPAARANDCAAEINIKSEQHACALSPDGSGCAGTWQQWSDGSWVDMPITVSTCPLQNPCCGIACGYYGSIDVVVSADGMTTCQCNCLEDFLGEHCELAPAYVIAGSTDAFNGRYERLAAMCSGKHVFQLHDGNVVLFQPTGFSFWSIGPAARANDCAAEINIKSEQHACALSPDGSGCAGTWQQWSDGSWVDMPITVSAWPPPLAPDPIDCVGAYGDLSDCSEPCGPNGVTTRSFSISIAASDGGQECTVAAGHIESQSCNTETACPVSCVGSMSDWSDCSLPCGGGSQTRNFIVSTPAANGGTCAAEGTSESQACNTDACPPLAPDPIDCVGSYGDLSDCSEPCGPNGVTTRSFSISTAASDGGQECTVAAGHIESQSCNTEIACSPLPAASEPVSLSSGEEEDDDSHGSVVIVVVFIVVVLVGLSVALALQNRTVRERLNLNIESTSTEPKTPGSMGESTPSRHRVPPPPRPVVAARPTTDANVESPLAME